MEVLVKYKKIISRVIGIVFMTLSIGYLFWDYANSSVSVSQSEIMAQKRVTMMEARNEAKSSAKSTDKPSLSNVDLYKQKTDTKILLIIMVLLGSVSFLYSFKKS